MKDLIGKAAKFKGPAGTMWINCVVVEIKIDEVGVLILVETPDGARYEMDERFVVIK